MCRVFLSGIIGSEPRETYLKNGHYVVSFSLAVVGHYQVLLLNYYNNNQISIYICNRLYMNGSDINPLKLCG
jgi:hypothetical protein